MHFPFFFVNQVILDPEYFKHYKSRDPIIILQRNFCSFLKYAVSWIYSDHEFHLLGVMLCCIGSVSGGGGMTVLVPVLYQISKDLPVEFLSGRGFPFHNQVLHKPLAVVYFSVFYTFSITVF